MSRTRPSVLCVDADSGAASTMASRLGTETEAAMLVETATTHAAAIEAISDGTSVLVVGDGIDPFALVAACSAPVVWCPGDDDQTARSRISDHETIEYVPRRGEWVAALAHRVKQVARADGSPDPRGSIADSERKIRNLHSSATEMAGLTEEMAVYRQIIEAAATILEFDLSYVGIEIDGWIVPIANSEEAMDGGARTMSVEEGLVGKTYRTGESYLIENVDTAAETDPARPEYRSGISVPIGGIGVFQAVACERAAFDRTDLELAELLCAHAAAVLTRISSEREYRRERDRFAALFENVLDPVIHYRYDDGSPIVRSANPAFESVFGFDRETAVGASLDALVVPSSATTRAVQLNDRVAAGERLDAEVERQTATGTRTFLLRNVPLSGGETCVGYAIYTDISEQKQHQETLSALQGTTRSLIRAETEVAIGDRLVEGAQRALALPYAAVLRYCSDEQELRPIATSERWGTLDTDLTAYLTFEAGGSLTWQAFERGEERIYADITTEPDVGRTEPKVRGAMILPIGEWGVFLIGSKSADAFDDADLDFARVLAASAEAALDRTARETTLRAREAELARQNQRLERFASVVSHDLRNPLTIARGRLDLAREGKTDQLDAVDDALERIESIIEDVLQLARDAEAITREPISLAACVRDAWAGVETGDATLSVGRCGTITADRSRLQQVFENLFRNAVEHGSTSSRNPQDSGDGVEHSSTSDQNAEQSGDCPEHDSTDNSELTICVDTFDGGFFVADDGTGIPREDREEIFAYGHSGGGGSGLGLAIVEGIVEAHGWTVTAADSADGGARFEIRTESSD